MTNNSCRLKFNFSLWIIVLGVFRSFLLLGLGWCLSGHRFCCGLRCLTQCRPLPSELPPTQQVKERRTWVRNAHRGVLLTSEGKSYWEVKQCLDHQWLCATESYLHFNLTRKQKSSIRRGPLIEHHNSTAPHRCSREISILEAEGEEVENFGLISKFPWDEQCCMALNFSVMSFPTMERFILSFVVRLVAIFN